MHGRTIPLSISLIILALPLFSSLQTSTAQGSASGSPIPNPILNISIDNPQQFTFDQSYYFQPAIVQGMDGTAWVFYEYIYFNQHSALPVIAYRTSQSPGTPYNSTNWSAQSTLSATPRSQNIDPSTSTYRNGTLYVAFASNRTGNFNIFVKKYNTGLGWGPDYQVTLNTQDQIGNSVVAANDGSLWVFYDRQVNSSTASIYYRVLHGGQTPVEVQFTNTTSGVQDQQPSAYQLLDGSIVVVWTHTDSLGNNNLYYRKYSNGVWGSVTQITTSNGDSSPKISQDENTTIWVAFTHEIPLGGSNFQNAVYYMYSINLGASWAASSNLTNDTCGTPCPNSMNAALAQFKDGRVYLFFSSNRDPQQYWNLYYAATDPQPFHNVAVTRFSVAIVVPPVLQGVPGVPPKTLRIGWQIYVNVTIANLGLFPENMFLTVNAVNKTSTTIAAQFVSLAAGQSITFTFYYNTNPLAPAKYTLIAKIPPVANEIVTGDNTMSAGVFKMVAPGDVNMDGNCDIIDAGTLGVAYNTRPGMANWNPFADLLGTGYIDIVDAATIGIWYGNKT